MIKARAGGRRDPARFGLALTVMLVAEALVLCALRLPLSLSFKQLAFQDPGSDLVIDYLTVRGDRPGVDNGYQYGLLSLAVGRVVFAVLGRNPMAFQALDVLANIALAWGLARFARYAGAGVVGVALLVLTLPYLTPSAYPCLTHMLEPAVLCHALVEHLRGRRTRALAMVSVCLFIKPTMAYLYGLLLTLLILRDWGAARPGRVSRLLRPFCPAVAVMAVLAVGLGWAYGAEPLVASVIPVSGARVYQANGFGFFFGEGCNFWRPPGARLGYYLGTFAGFWIAGTFALLAGAAVAVGRSFGAGKRAAVVPNNTEVACVCAALHVMFVFLFFGNSLSWFYYGYVLVLGLVALIPLISRTLSAAVLAGLFVLALLSQRSVIGPILGYWRTLMRGPETASLYASPEEREEWLRVMEATRGQKAVILAISEGLPLIAPGFEPPVLWYIAHAGLRRPEVERKRAQIAHAGLVVEVKSCYGKWPSEEFASELGKTLAGFEHVYVGRLYRVFQRSKPASEPRRADRP